MFPALGFGEKANMSNPLYDQYKTNKDLEVSGIFFEAGEIKEKDAHGNDVVLPIRFKIARSGGANASFAKAMERESKPYKRAIQTKTLSNDQANTIFLRAFVAGSLLGWENVRDANNQPMQFTFDSAVNLLTELPDLFTDLREASQDASLFREAELEHDVGNSGPSSSTA